MALITSPLRYPGGKSGFTPFLADVLDLNGLSDCCFIEPFAGGAGAALNLLWSGLVKRIVINDIDKAIASIWQSILYNTDNFLKLLRDTPVNVDEWRFHKHIYTNPGEHTELELGFATFYLNRTNRSGVLAANPIGGIKQSGKWKIDARFNKKELSNRIKAIASMAKAISVYSIDAIDLLNEVSTWSETRFVYLDPPYFAKGADLYLNHYVAEDHEKLANQLTGGTNYPWLATYDESEHIRWLYRYCDITSYNLSYYVAKWRKGVELCISPMSITLPDSKPAFSYTRARSQHST